jgi:hypothetical protein
MAGNDRDSRSEPEGFPLSPISVEGETVTFSMKGVPGDPLFKGKISKEPRSIAGEFSQGGQRCLHARVEGRAKD